MNNKPIEELNTYATAKQLAQLLGLSKSGFYALYKRGQIPRGIKIGHARRWNLAEFQAWLAKKQDNE
ncbi:MAG: helix-turn-helix domain-containing protein [Synergistaceae bacterium]|nr:helix-turn-helix domain-containing protein [Synergistaceae bacterium]MBR1436941.1 helix-turn-helix domain-containing protein [Synergistaceae bacterium]